MSVSVTPPTAPCAAALRRLDGDELGARRRPDLDDDFFVGWEIAGGVTIEVSAHAARVKNGADRYHLLCRPEQPDVWSARLVAAALGLPADTGAMFAGRARSAEPDGPVLHHSTVTHPSWAVEASGGSEMERGAIAALPPLDVTEERLLLEAEVGAQDLLAELRALEPPPTAPALLVGLAVEQKVLYLHRDGIEEVERRIEVDGTVEERRRLLHRWQLERNVGERSDLRLVATAAVREVSVQVERLHRSHLLSIATPGRRRQWFVPADEDCTQASESAWADFVDRQGLGSDSVIALDRRRAPSGANAFAAPSGADLVRRKVIRRWVRSSDVPPVERIAPCAERAAEFGLQIADGARSEPQDPAFGCLFPAIVEEIERQTVATGLRREDRDVVFRERLEVFETWRGAVSTEVDYLVWPGQEAWPPLADGERASDFVVDLMGRLRRPEDARWAQLDDCGDCGRKMLLGSTACPWCAPLVDVDAPDAMRLPGELHTEGCALYWVPALEGRPLLIVGSQRLELARLDGASVDEWISASALSPAELTLALGGRSVLRLHGDLVIQPRSGTGRAMEPLGDEEIELSHVLRRVARYRVSSATHAGGLSLGRGDIAGGEHSIDHGEDALGQVIAALGAADTPVPRPAESTKRSLLEHLRTRIAVDREVSVAATMEVSESSTFRRITATAAGLRSVGGSGDGLVGERVVAWRRPGAVPWLEPAMGAGRRSKIGTIVCWASLGAVEAAVIDRPDGRVIVCHDDGQLEWHEVSAPWTPDIRR